MILPLTGSLPRSKAGSISFFSCVYVILKYQWFCFRIRSWKKFGPNYKIMIQFNISIILTFILQEIKYRVKFMRSIPDLDLCYHSRTRTGSGLFFSRVRIQSFELVGCVSGSDPDVSLFYPEKSMNIA